MTQWACVCQVLTGREQENRKLSALCRFPEATRRWQGHVALAYDVGRAYNLYERSCGCVGGVVRDQPLRPF